MVMGRPKIEFDEKDWKLIDVACQYKHSEQGIADLLDCSLDTLVRRIKEQYGCTFAQYRNKRIAKTKHSLFGKQVEVAMNGNVSMLIWLGKNYLGQSDKSEVKTEVDQDKPFIVNFTRKGDGE